MPRRSARSIHTTGAFLGATAIALAGSPAAAETEPELRLLPPLASLEASPVGVGGPAGGGPSMGRTVLTAPTSKTTLSYTVKAGDTVWAIAQKNSTSVTEVIKANGLGSNALIRVGQKLTIPGGSTKSTSPTGARVSGSSTHTVKAGETLSAIAAKHGTTTTTLATLNKISNPNVIRPGQVLKLNGTTTSAKPSPTPSQPTQKTTAGSHTVKAGETVWAIAQSRNVAVSAIISANGLSDDAFIRVGQKLTIPAPGQTTTPAAPSNACKNVVPATFLHYTYSDDVVRAANENKCTLDAMSVPSRTEMQNIVRHTAVSMGVDPSLAQAVAFQESGFNHRAVSPANAIGTMQVIPSSGEWAGQMLGRDINLLDPHQNASAGVAILRSLQRSFPNNLDYAIGAYYQGAGSVSKYGLAADTRNYVNAIKAHMKRFN